MVNSSPTNNAFIRTAICLATDAVGDVVYVTGPQLGNDYQVTKVDIFDPTTLPGVAIITYKISSTRAVIQLSGEIRNVYNGLIPGETYWVGPLGYPVTPPPVPPFGQLIANQPVGVAVKEDVLFFESIRNIVALQG